MNVSLGRWMAVLLLGLAVPLSAQSALFVNSAPIRAEVVVNGVPLGSTPLLLENQPAGVYEIDFVKQGYLPLRRTVELAGGRVDEVAVRLEPDSFVASFSADETIAGGRVYQRQESTLTLPAGHYEISGVGTSMVVDPVYPHESALGAARIATLAGLVVAVISTVEDTLLVDGRSFFTSYLPTPGTIASWTLALGAGGFWWALERDRRVCLEQSAIVPYSGGLTETDAERLYREGDAALAAGNLSRALTQYARIIAESADSEFLPQAFYKAAQIYSVSGDGALATQMLELLLIDLPSVEVYDRALHSLAELYSRAGRVEEAVGLLLRMLFADPLFDPADVQGDLDALRARLQEARQ